MAEPNIHFTITNHEVNKSCLPCSVVDWLIPQRELDSLLGSGRMSVLKRAATDGAYSMRTCRSKFACNPPTVVQGGERPSHALLKI